MSAKVSRNVLKRVLGLFRRRRQQTAVPRGVERVCVGMGSQGRMMLKAREITRAPVLGVGVALTTGEYEMEVEPCGHDDLWRLMVWIDRDADHRTLRRLKSLSGASA